MQYVSFRENIRIYSKRFQNTWEVWLPSEEQEDESVALVLASKVAYIYQQLGVLDSMTLNYEATVRSLYEDLAESESVHILLDANKAEYDESYFNDRYEHTYYETYKEILSAQLDLIREYYDNILEDVRLLYKGYDFIGSELDKLKFLEDELDVVKYNFIILEIEKIKFDLLEQIMVHRLFDINSMSIIKYAKTRRWKDYNSILGLHEYKREYHIEDLKTQATKEFLKIIGLPEDYVNIYDDPYVFDTMLFSYIDKDHVQEFYCGEVESHPDYEAILAKGKPIYIIIDPEKTTYCGGKYLDLTHELIHTSIDADRVPLTQVIGVLEYTPQPWHIEEYGITF